MLTLKTVSYIWYRWQTLFWAPYFGEQQVTIIIDTKARGVIVQRWRPTALKMAEKLKYGI